MSLLDASMPFHSALLEDALCLEEECEGGDSSGQERRRQTGDLINVSLVCVLGCKHAPTLSSLTWSCCS